MSWTTAKLDELGFVGRGKSRHRPRNDASLYGGDHPFIQTADIASANYYIEGFKQTYSDKGLAQSKLWSEETLCITIAGENTAKTAVLNFPACFPDSIVGFVPDKEKSDLRFVKHSLDMMKASFRSVSKGATQDNLSLGKILSFDIPVPSVEYQKKVSGVLAAYDDLIENNRRRIALLEQAARLLYREWFVHFRFPGHETVSFVDGLPEDWARTELSEVCSTNKASHKKGKIPDSVRYIDIGSVSTGRIDGVTEYKAEDAPGRARRIAEPMDTIWSNVRPNLQAYSLVMSPKENDVFSTGFTVIHAETVSPLFLYLTVTTDDFVKYLTNHATGASYPAVRSDDFDRAEVLVPTDELMNAFHEFAEPIFQQRQMLGEHSDQLANARDLLLPRLMDGRIPV